MNLFDGLKVSLSHPRWNNENILSTMEFYYWNAAMTFRSPSRQTKWELESDYYDDIILAY